MEGKTAGVSALERGLEDRGAGPVAHRLRGGLIGTAEVEGAIKSEFNALGLRTRFSTRGDSSIALNWALSEG